MSQYYPMGNIMKIIEEVSFIKTKERKEVSIAGELVSIMSTDRKAINEFIVADLNEKPGEIIRMMKEIIASAEMIIAELEPEDEK